MGGRGTQAGVRKREVGKKLISATVYVEAGVLRSNFLPQRILCPHAAQSCCIRVRANRSNDLDVILQSTV